MEPNRNDQNKNKPNNKKPKGNLWVALGITAAILLIISWAFNFISTSQYTQTDFSHFMQAKESNNLAEVEIRYDRIVYLTKDEAEKPGSEQKAFYTGLPNGDRLALAEELDAMGVTVDNQIVEDNSTIIMILSYVVMFVLVFAGMSFITKRMSGESMMSSIGANKAKMYVEKQTGVTFKDVAGQDEAKESLQEIIDFLHNPQKYTEIGAKLP